MVHSLVPAHWHLSFPTVKALHKSHTSLLCKYIHSNPVQLWGKEAEIMEGGGDSLFSMPLPLLYFMCTGIRSYLRLLVAFPRNKDGEITPIPEPLRGICYRTRAPHL